MTAVENVTAPDRPARPTSPRPGRAELGALLVVTLAGAALRAGYLNQPMRYDEAFTYLAYASQPLATGLTRYDYPNNHLLHTLLVHLSTAALGNHPWTIRLPAYAAGVALIPAWWWAIRALYPGPAGLLTAALVAGCSALVEFSTNARGYMLVALACGLLVGLGALLLRGPTPARWTGFAALAGLALWTVPVALLGVGAVAAWLGLEALWGRPPAGRLRFLAGLALALAAAAGLTALLYLPVVRAAGLPALVGNRFVAPLPGPVLLDRLPGSLAAAWRLATRDLPRPLLAVLLAGVALAVLRHGRVGAHRVPLLPVTLAWCAAVVLAQRVVPFPRVWLFAFPLALGTAAAGLAGLRPRQAPPVAAPLAAGMLLAILAVATLTSRGVLLSRETGTLRAAAPMAALLRARLGPGDAVLATLPANQPLAYYLDRDGVPPSGYLAQPGRGLWRHRRLFVVVAEDEGQTLPGVLAAFVPPGAAVGPPRELGRWESGALYELGPLRPR